MTFPHLDGRAEKLVKELRLPADKAEWLAVAALHAGCFVRSQYCECFEVRRQRAAEWAADLIARNLVVEDTVDDLGVLCRITSKTVYRCLGAADIRHRRLASWPIMHRRLLSLDYVLDHSELPWLPTEPEKLATFDALEVPRSELPRRRYRGAVGSAVRYFANKHPIAVDSRAKSALFVYVDSDEQSPQGLRSWRDEHARLWSRLCGLGFGLSIVHAGRNPQLAERVRRIFGSWRNAPAETQNKEAMAAERQRLRTALETDDDAVLDEYGGFNEALQRSAELGRWLETAGNRGATYKADYSVWLSKRLAPKGAWRNNLGSRWNEAAAQGDEA